MNVVDEFISKSQKKRDAEALQKLGVELIALSMEDLNELPIHDRLKEAIMAAKSIKSHGAIRRQTQWIGKLMRLTDQEALIQAYEHLCQSKGAQTQVFHEIEQWRLRFMSQDARALTEFVQAYPQTEVQKLRQCIKKALDEQSQQVNHGANKALFRIIKASMV